jgi:2-methylisocitrate lyase-like PEP mutase family enzyme
VLTARSENYLHDRADLADTIARLQAYQAAGADVLYAPGLNRPDEIRSVVTSVDLPVNVLALPSGPDVSALAALGVRRISVGGAFAYAAIAGLVDAGREFLESGTLKFWDRAAIGGAAARAAFTR